METLGERTEGFRGCLRVSTYQQGNMGSLVTLKTLSLSLSLRLLFLLTFLALTLSSWAEANSVRHHAYMQCACMCKPMRAHVSHKTSLGCHGACTSHLLETSKNPGPLVVCWSPPDTECLLGLYFALYRRSVRQYRAKIVFLLRSLLSYMSGINGGKFQRKEKDKQELLWRGWRWWKMVSWRPEKEWTKVCLDFS